MWFAWFIHPTQKPCENLRLVYHFARKNLRQGHHDPITPLVAFAAVLSLLQACQTACSVAVLAVNSATLHRDRPGTINACTSGSTIFSLYGCVTCNALFLADVSLIQQGKSLYDTGNFAEAIAMLQQVAQAYKA